MIERTHKGTKIKPANLQRSFTPYVGTEAYKWNGTALCVVDRPGCETREYTVVGFMDTGASGKVSDLFRITLEDWDNLVAQVEALRQKGTN